MMGSAIFTEQPAFIVSACKGATDDEQRTAAMAYWLRVHHIGFKPVIGCYKSSQEQSFFCIPGDKAQALLEYAFGTALQESVLHLDPWRSATLIFQDGRKEPIGRFHSVHETIAKQRDAYTYDPSTKAHYVCD